jgi:hypothetical protein
MGTATRDDLLKVFNAENLTLTNDDWANLIDSMLNQEDDHLRQEEDGPLRISAKSADKPVLKFYASRAATQPDWSLSLTAKADQDGPGKTVPGFAIVEGDPKKVRLFLEGKTGRVGIGTASPGASLDVAGDARVTGAAQVKALRVTGDKDSGSIQGPKKFTLQSGSETEPGELLFLTATGGSGNNVTIAERMRIDATGDIVVSGKIRGPKSFALEASSDQEDGEILFLTPGKGSRNQIIPVERMRIDAKGDVVVTGRITPSAGKGPRRGIHFKEDALGGSGDKAWIQYYALEMGPEKAVLEIGVEDKHIALVPGKGNVGIGTEFPGAKLEVAGDVLVTGDLVVKGRISSPRWQQALNLDRNILPIKTDFTTNGGTVVLFVSGAGWSRSGNSLLTVLIKIDGAEVGKLTQYVKEKDFHVEFRSKVIWVPGLSAEKKHSLELVSGSPDTVGDENDHFQVVGIEFPF